MQKIILITGATDGIGLETAKALTQQGHHVLIHGRKPFLDKINQDIAHNPITKQNVIKIFAW